MARAFIPCIYHEWEREDALEGSILTRYNALELFDICWLASRAPDVLLTRDSQQYHVNTMQTEEERLHVPETRARLAHGARERLFTTFYEDRAR
jgi:hypothetical protein